MTCYSWKFSYRTWPGQIPSSSSLFAYFRSLWYCYYPYLPLSLHHHRSIFFVTIPCTDRPKIVPVYLKRKIKLVRLHTSLSPTPFGKVKPKHKTALTRTNSDRASDDSYIINFHGSVRLCVGAQRAASSMSSSIYLGTGFVLYCFGKMLRRFCIRFNASFGDNEKILALDEDVALSSSLLLLPLLDDKT